MNREKIIKKVLAKLHPSYLKTSDSECLSKKEVMELIFKDYVDKEDTVKPEFGKNMEISKEQYQELKNIHENGHIERVHDSPKEFGFTFEGLRFDVDPDDLEIKNI